MSVFWLCINEEAGLDKFMCGDLRIEIVFLRYIKNVNVKCFARVCTGLHLPQQVTGGSRMGPGGPLAPRFFQNHAVFWQCLRNPPPPYFERILDLSPPSKLRFAPWPKSWILRCKWCPNVFWHGTDSTHCPVTCLFVSLSGSYGNLNQKSRVFSGAMSM